MANPLVEAMKIGEEKARREMEVATHDNRPFKRAAPPVTGPAADQPAGQVWKDLLKDESLLKTIERLKISSERTNTGGITGKEFKIPAEGPGGYKDNPYDDFGNYRGPSVPGHPGWAISHGTHQEPDGWSMPSGTHDPAEHKQYDPGGGPLFNPLDGGDVVPWDERPKEIASVDYSGIPNNRDLMIKKIINTYGKDDKGNYKDPTLLIKGLLDAARV